jgi:hypothetical protein
VKNHRDNCDDTSGAIMDSLHCSHAVGFYEGKRGSQRYSTCIYVTSCKLGARRVLQTHKMSLHAELISWGKRVPRREVHVRMVVAL